MNRPEHYESDLLFYFDGKPREFFLYQRLFESMEQAFPDASVKVQKSQISFYCPKLFAAASIPVRWTHHVVVSQPEEIDGELLDWLSQAYQFCQIKGSRR